MDGGSITRAAKTQARIQRGNEELGRVRARVQELISAKDKYAGEIAYYEQQVLYTIRRIRSLQQNKISDIQDS